MINFNSIPEELKQINQWVLWKAITKTGQKKPTKIPYQLNHKEAKTNDHLTWNSFQNIYEGFNGNGKNFTGIGFVFSKKDPYVGIDFDNCVDEKGNISEEVKTWIKYFKSYTEYSQSKKGIHIIVKGVKPGDRKQKNGIEIYDSVRYFAFTGNTIKGYQEIRDCQKELNEFYYKIFQKELQEEKDRSYEKFTPQSNKEEYYEEILSIIKENCTGMFNSYEEDFLPFIMGCKAAGLPYEAIDNILQQSEGYNEKNNRKIYENLKPKTINFGRVYHYAEKATGYKTKEALAEIRKKKRPRIEKPKKSSPLPKPETAQEGEIIWGNMEVHDTPPEKNTSLNFYTDTWNGEQLVKRHGENIRYCAKWKSWILWNKKRWEEDESIKIQAMAKDTIKNFHKLIGKIEDEKERDQFINHIKSSESMTKRRYMVEAAMSEPGIPVMPNIFDNNKWLLNLNNGTLNLESMELKEHRREDYIMKLIDSNYNPEAKCETWLKFLDRIFGGNKSLINFVQRIAGYALTGLTVEQCIFILYGSGSNGKSTFINMIKEVLCDYAQQTPSETLMEKRNTGGVSNDLARLRGARFVASIETEQGKCFAEALVKQLSGGDDTITARFLNKEFFEFVPECKIFIATNHKPKIKNTDHAIWRRIKLIPFTVTIPEEEKDLKFMDKLRKEKEGILAWMVEGCKLWQSEGLQTPEEVIAATQEYKEEMDVIGAFIDECCVVGLKYRTLAKDLYEIYSKWCEENGEYTMSQRSFGLKLTDRGYERTRVFSGHNRGKFAYVGLGILDAEPNSEPEEDYHL